MKTGIGARPPSGWDEVLSQAWREAWDKPVREIFNLSPHDLFREAVELARSRLNARTPEDPASQTESDGATSDTDASLPNAIGGGSARASSVARTPEDTPSSVEEVEGSRRNNGPGSAGGGSSEGEDHITMHEGRCGGRPCVGHSRVPVALVDEIERSSGIEVCKEAYPHVAHLIEPALRLFRRGEQTGERNFVVNRVAHFICTALDIPHDDERVSAVAARIVEDAAVLRARGERLEWPDEDAGFLYTLANEAANGLQEPERERLQAIAHALIRSMQYEPGAQGEPGEATDLVEVAATHGRTLNLRIYPYHRVYAWWGVQDEDNASEGNGPDALREAVAAVLTPTEPEETETP